MRPEMTLLTERDTDEVDLILIPVAKAVTQLRTFLDRLGISRGQKLLVIRERMDIARQILAECEHDYPSKAVH